MLNRKGLAKQFSQSFFSEGKKGLAKQFFPGVFCTRSNFPILQNPRFCETSQKRSFCKEAFFATAKKGLSEKGRAESRFPWDFFATAKKGQESAPFELLVAVIIMGFVIFIGTSVMQQVNCEKCKGETNAKLDRMATALQNADESGSIQPNVSFFLSGCFNQQEEKIWIEDEDDPQVCAAYHCGEKQLCTLLKYYGNGCGGFSIIKCLDITPDADFPSISGGRCEERDGMQLVDFEKREEPIATGGNKQGNYLLWNKTGQGDTFSTICAYRKEG